MPKVNTRTLADGSTRYFVRFRADKTQTSLAFTTRPEAHRFAQDVETRGGQWALDNYLREEADAAEPTLDEWATRWRASLTVSPATLDNYRRDWERRWKPHLGHMKLSQITREDIVAAVKAQDGAPKTVANAWGSLASMLKTAVADGLIERSPALGVRLPKHVDHERVEHRYLTQEEFHRVVANTREHYRPLVWMLGGTGMRWSEATALTVGDVDLAAQTVRVTKAWKHDRPQRAWYIGSPKTAKSRRTITLPPEVVQAVRPLIEGRRRAERLFTNHRGDPVKHQTFYREHWREYCINGLPEPRPRIHDLRHSHVAWLIAANIPLPVIQARLGHEKITTTIDTYGHLLPDLQVAAADAASKALGGTSPRAELP